MSNAANKKSNQYADVCDAHIGAPKDVYAALAFSLAMRLSSDDPRAAVAELRSEWDILHANGIVPQKRR